MKCITGLGDEVRGKYALVRAGLDVPLDFLGEVSDMFRVERSALTLRFLREHGARTIILSHVGRDSRVHNESVARALRSYVPVTYVQDLLGAHALDARRMMRDGDILMLDNLRSDPREETNNETFARDLASLGDLYVNDAFSNSHRAHASMVSLPKFLPCYGGILLREEIEKLLSARTPANPSLAILGGAKFETKEPLIKLLLDRYGHLFIAGALANDSLKALGNPVGVSLVSPQLPDNSVLGHPNTIVPVDVTVERPDGQARVKKPHEVAAEDRIVDIGPDSVARIAPIIASAKTILWNGPTGIEEHGYVHYTQAIFELIFKCQAQAIIGGGDTIAAIRGGAQAIKSKRTQDVSSRIFFSTGGGAMLDYLLNGSLPAIDALG